MAGSSGNKAISASNKVEVEVEAVNLHLVSWTGKCPEIKLSRVGVGGWLDQVGVRLSQLSTKLKLKLSLAIFDICPIIV